jgi:Zn-dependent peptidase ImmA (M78 family)
MSNCVIQTHLICLIIHLVAVNYWQKYSPLVRESVENKGIMVIVSNGYNGPWQIDKSDPTRGFCLYYDMLPIIAIKKQSKGAMAFTLMHELAHLI